MELRMKNVTFANGNRQKINEIYKSSFHKEDRMPFMLMLIMGYLKSTHFISFHDGDTICGFVYMATIKKTTFVMFFAVDENIRSKGYGSRILDKIQSLYPDNKIIITIERCDEDAEDIEERLRRKKFYTNNGYMQAGYIVKLGNHKQEIIIKNGEFDKREFILFFLRYSNFTMMPKVWKIGS